jgi:hypothetical protein
MRVLVAFRDRFDGDVVAANLAIEARSSVVEMTFNLLWAAATPLQADQKAATMTINLVFILPRYQRL